MPTDHYFSAALFDDVVRILRLHPQGLSEYELIQALEQRNPGFRPDLGQPLGLFRTHFILFHYLYRLRAQLRAAGEELEIHCLRIVLRSGGAPQPGGIARRDTLADYYLNLSNLERTTDSDVNDLLRAFWRRFQRADQRSEALSVLGLVDPVTAEEIRLQYRRLVMRHHPDRGGDTAMLQALNRAMEQLTDSE